MQVLQVSLSVVSDSATPWTVACQAPLSVGFSRQEYWSGLPFSQEDLPNPGIELWSLALQADSLPSEPPGNPLVIPERVLERMRSYRTFSHGLMFQFSRDGSRHTLPPGIQTHWGPCTPGPG